LYRALSIFCEGGTGFLRIISRNSCLKGLILVGKPEGKRPLGRPRGRWVDNIKMDLRDIRRGGMDWIDLAQDKD
jgi:hypothetical protein